MTVSPSSAGAAASSGCIRPSLRTIGGVPTDKCKSEAPAAHIARNKASISPDIVCQISRSSTICALLTITVPAGVST